MLLVTGNCSIKNNLSVLGNNDLLNTMNIKTSGQGGGNLRIEPSVDGQETSIGYYNRSDLRATVAGDMWVGGLNCWGLAGDSIGTVVIGNCLNISNVGTVKAPYKMKTPLIYTDKIIGNGATQVTIDDDVIITGNLHITGTITASKSNLFI